ncbi:MAG: hypothetical protein IJ664_01175 [Clostridia bacterium]|nr:hypothetical protein [Clostridia bacterium]
MDVKQLEQKRLTCLIMYFVGLLLEGAGVFAMSEKQIPGIILCCMGILLWIVGSLWAKRRYQNACGHARVLHGLGMPDAKFYDKKEAASLGFPTQKLVPGGRVADPPMFLFTAQGTLRGQKATVTEMTQAYHDEGDTKRKYLVGTLVRLPAAGCGAERMILCGKAYGGTLRAEDFAPMTLQETPGHAFHMLSRENDALEEKQSAALDVFCQNEERSAVFLQEKGFVGVFLPMRFYSGTYAMREKMTEEVLDQDPLPELDDALKVLLALAQ